MEWCSSLTIAQRSNGWENSSTISFFSQGSGVVSDAQTKDLVRQMDLWEADGNDEPFFQPSRVNPGLTFVSTSTLLILRKPVVLGARTRSPDYLSKVVLLVRTD